MQLRENELTFDQYRQLRTSVGWNNWSASQSEQALKNSLLAVSAISDGAPIAMGRIIGDGMYYLIVDVVVCPEFQHQGIGTQIMNYLLDYVYENTPVGGRSSIQLLAEPGKEEFYLKLGFKQVPHEYCGSAMRKIIRR